MFRKVVVFLVRIFLSIWFKVEVENVERFEKLKTSCIVAPNHQSAWDTVLVPAFSKRVMYMMAKAELFENKIFGALLKGLKAFPVKRGKGDITAVKTAVSLLNQGQSICMFPEGTRNKGDKPIRFKTGASRIAITAKVPILPVAIVSDFKFRGKVKIIYGEPIYFDECYDKTLTKEDFQKETDRVQNAVEQMIENA